jgi:hypothetical protein
MNTTRNEDGSKPVVTIIIENPEVLDGSLYTGEIVSVHTGYVFIHNVKRGYETIGTNGDVFCPVPLDAKFENGQLIQFSELNPDKERVGKFRAETISKMNSDIIENTPEGRMVAINQLSKSEHPYHHFKKMINDDDLSKAGENKPMVEFVQQIAWLLNRDGSYSPEYITQLAEEFVAKTFSMLTPLGFKCSINGSIDLEAEKISSMKP